MAKHKKKASKNISMNLQASQDKNIEKVEKDLYKIADKNIDKNVDVNVPLQRNYRFNFIGRSKFVVLITTVFIIAGIIFFILRGFNFGIDFLGGNLMEVKFKQNVSITELRDTMAKLGYNTAILQSTGPDRYIIRTKTLTADQKNAILDGLDKSIGITKPLIQDRNVAAGFSQTIIKNTLIAVAISIAGILIYVWIRFEIRFAVVAIVELIHDLLVILSFYAVTFREFNTISIAVILTILGYSLSDSIIIFDRIREELKLSRKDRFIDLVNYSMNKTLVRSLGTIATTLFPIIILMIVGNETLKDFAFGLFVGIVSGSYSSIFIGPPILNVWNNVFPRYKK
ncbi:MAG: protein translocase subunit SecF [Actinobacteria bacterium]|nr:protein translocase subunit SecF [Actinomycetota bacterium]